jgi:hypothetical protein
MKSKKKVSVHLIFIILHLISALLTVIPNAGASKPCRLGYYALCSFTPFSTLISLALAGMHYFFLTRENNGSASQKK